MMRRHIDAETLARFRQGDLSPRQNARIRAHLAGCERCRDLNEDLAGVTTMLASAQPPPIPEHLTARIQTALATEAARRVALTAGAAAGNPAAGDPLAGNTVTDAAGIAGAQAPEPPQDGRSPRRERPGHGRRRPRLPRFSSPIALRAAAAAAAVVVIAGGVYEVTQHAGSSSSSSSPSSGAAAPRAAPAAGGARNSGLAAGPSAAGPHLRYLHAGHQDTFTPITTSTDFTPTHLRSQVSSELAQHSSAIKQAGPSGVSPNPDHSSAATQGGPPATFGNTSFPTLEACVGRIAASEVVLLVEVAYYQNARATVIVTEVSAVTPEQVWVVGTGCSGTRSDVLAHVTLPPGG
jgi:hypothetical protein